MRSDAGEAGLGLTNPAVLMNGKAEPGMDASPTQRPAARGRKLVLFDFDGTITTKDTLIEFVRFYHGKRKYWSGLIMLTPVLALFALRILPNWKAKQFFLTRFFKGESLQVFDEQCIKFSTVILPTLIRPRAKEAIDRYLAEKATVAVVSASAENWVAPWCDAMGIHALCTRLEARDGVLTGRISGRNCYGDEKVCRVRERFDLSRFEEIIAYGDSRGDREMLALAQQKHYKPFRHG